MQRWKKTVRIFTLAFLGSVSIVQAAPVATVPTLEEAPFDLVEAISMEAFLRGVAYQCLTGKALGDFINNSKRQVAFAAQDFGLDEQMYQLMESDIEEKANYAFFKQLTPMQCEKYKVELRVFSDARNQTLNTLEDILRNELGVH